MTKEEKKFYHNKYRNHGYGEQCKRETERMNYVRKFFKFPKYNIFIRNSNLGVFMFDVIIVGNATKGIVQSYHTYKLETAYNDALIWGCEDCISSYEPYIKID